MKNIHIYAATYSARWYGAGRCGLSAAKKYLWIIHVNRCLVLCQGPINSTHIIMPWKGISSLAKRENLSMSHSPVLAEKLLEQYCALLKIFLCSPSCGERASNWLNVKLQFNSFEIQLIFLPSAQNLRWERSVWCSSFSPGDRRKEYEHQKYS